MINIITKFPGEIDRHEEWKLGDKKSHLVYGLRVGSIIHLIATNRELNWIRANVSGVRMHPGHQVRWIGEDATFIANSLPKPEELEGQWL
jgi:hypothetical protein